MLLEVHRGRWRAAMLGGTALLALLNALPGASAQDQPATNPPPAQTPAPQESTPPSPSPPAPPAQTPSTPAPIPSPQTSGGGTQLPQINVRAARRPAPRPAPRVARRPAPANLAPTTVPPVSPAEVLTRQSNSFDQARSNLYTTIGTTSDTKSHETIEALPQGTNAAVERVLLQAPGVSQDSAASGLFHVRNDHANAQYRINGILLPDGVSGFGSILDTNFIGSLSLVTGPLPAEYGLRTTGIIDLTTRTDIFNNSGSINYYFGTRTDTAQLRIWRHLRCQLPEHKFSAANESAGIVGNVFRRRAILLHW